MVHCSMGVVADCTEGQVQADKSYSEGEVPAGKTGAGSSAEAGDFGAGCCDR